MSAQRRPLGRGGALLVLVIVAPLALCLGSFLIGLVTAKPAAAPTPVPLGRCSTPDAQRLTDTVQSKAREWDDAVKLANNSPRIALAAQVQDLQRVRREAAALSVPSCGTKTQALMLTYMDTTINAFLDFLGQGSQYTSLFTQASTQFDAFGAELRHVTVGP